MSIQLFKSFFDYDRWANERIYAWAQPLADDLLDRRFEMGCGSLRETLRHSYWAARIWYVRIDGAEHENTNDGEALSSIASIRSADETLHAVRDRWLSTLSDAALVSVIDFKDTKGNPYQNTLRDILLHVANHGTHHRAQALNMLRHVGVAVQSIDYIYWKR